jgi:hypothetical protein
MRIQLTVQRSRSRVGAAAIVLLAFAVTVPSMAQPAVDRGESLLKQGNLHGAWAEVISPAQSGNARAQFIAGMVANNRGQTVEARQWWQKSMAQGYSESYTAMGYLAMGGRGGEVRSAANAATVSGPAARLALEVGAAATCAPERVAFRRSTGRQAPQSGPRAYRAPCTRARGLVGSVTCGPSPTPAPRPRSRLAPGTAGWR